MAGRIEGKVALVTGGSRGLGRAIGLELAGAGAAVVVNYARAQAMADSLVAEIKAAGGDAIAVQADVSRQEQCQALFEASVEAFGKVDILINNAGINRDRTLQRMTADEWHAVIDTDLNSAFYLTSLVISGMRNRRFGRIVNMSSILGQTGNPGQANYAAAKAGLIALTKTAAQELARFNITVNAICPGYVETDMVSVIKDDMRAALLEKIPLGRFGQPEEVAALCRFLVTEAAWMTGQQLNLNGGQYM